MGSSASWNLCVHDEERADAKMDDLCWYEADRSFDGVKEMIIERFTVAEGDWYIAIKDDKFGLTRGVVKDASVSGKMVNLPLTPELESCEV